MVYVYVVSYVPFLPKKQNQYPGYHEKIILYTIINVLIGEEQTGAG